MNFKYTKFSDQGSLFLTDFNCASFDKRLGEGDFYKIVWAKDKGIVIRVDGYSIDLKKNQILFCTPYNKLYLEPYLKGAVSYIFNREFYCIRDHDHEVSCNGLLFLGTSEPIKIELTEKERKSFELLYMFFEEEFETKDQIQGEMLLVLLKRLLIKSVRLVKRSLVDSELSQTKIDVVRQYNLLVDQHFKEKHKVSDYAELLNKSPKTLANAFAKFNDKSPLQIINERITLEARRLLTFSEKSSKEIAHNLGFHEASHFSKFFKNQVGESPTVFRKRE